MEAASAQREPEARAPTSKTHVFFHPLKCTRPPTDKVAGEFMIEVFHKYKEVVRKLENLTFTITLLLHKNIMGTAEVMMSCADCRQLEMWLMFASSACMHERMFSDFYDAVDKVC